MCYISVECTACSMLWALYTLTSLALRGIATLQIPVVPPPHSPRPQPPPPYTWSKCRAHRKT